MYLSKNNFYWSLGTQGELKARVLGLLGENMRKAQNLIINWSFFLVKNQ